MRTLAVVSLVLASSLPHARGQALDPIAVTFLPGGAESLDCRLQWQTRAPVVARSAPTDLADAIRGIDAMRRVDANDYTEALTAVLEPGRARAAAPFVVEDAAPLSGGSSVALRIGAGETISFLTEGRPQTFVYLGRTYRGTLDGLEVVSRPVAELWVRLVPREDRPAAWLNTAQAGIVPWDPSCE